MEGEHIYYVVTSPEIQGLVVESDTETEAIAIAQDLVPVLLGQQGKSCDSLEFYNYPASRRLTMALLQKELM